MKWLSMFGCAAVLVLVGAQASAGTTDTTDDGLPTFSTPRSERLDIYGAGMCHQCEWNPHPRVMAAADQCGVDATGGARLAVFECGRNPACDTVCNFVKCQGE